MPNQKIVLNRGSYDALFHLYCTEEEINGQNGKPGFLTPQSTEKRQEQIKRDLNRLPYAIKSQNEDKESFDNTWKSKVMSQKNSTDTVYIQGDLIAASLMKTKIHSLYNLDESPVSFDNEQPLKSFEIRTLDNENRPMGISITWHPEKPEELFSISIAKNIMAPNLRQREMIVITPESIHNTLTQRDHPMQKSQKQLDVVSTTASTSSISSALSSLCAKDKRALPLLNAIFPENKGINFKLLTDLANSSKLVAHPSNTTFSTDTLFQFTESFSPIANKLNEIEQVSQEIRWATAPLKNNINQLLNTMLVQTDNNYDPNLFLIYNHLCHRQINNFIIKNNLDIEPIDYLTEDRLTGIIIKDDKSPYSDTLKTLIYLVNDIQRSEAKLTEENPNSLIPLCMSYIQLLLILGESQIKLPDTEKIIQQQIIKMNETTPRFSIPDSVAKEWNTQLFDTIINLITQNNIPENIQEKLLNIATSIQSQKNTTTTELDKTIKAPPITPSSSRHGWENFVSSNTTVPSCKTAPSAPDNSSPRPQS